MEPETITLKPIAFEEILRSVYETARQSESFGFLFGEIHEKRDKSIDWIVESAIPVQTAKRVPQGILYYEDIEERLKKPLITENIGDYHSHIPCVMQRGGLRIETPGEYRPSKEDERGLCPDRINLIIGLKKIKKMGMLVDNPFLISGYLRDNKIIYRINIAGYYFNGKKRRAIIKSSKKTLKLIR